MSVESRVHRPGRRWCKAWTEPREATFPAQPVPSLAPSSPYAFWTLGSAPDHAHWATQVGALVPWR